MEPGADTAVPAGYAQRITGFVQHLRLNGFQVGRREQVEMADFLAREVRPMPVVRRSLRIMACGTKEDWDRFDDLFEAYWIGAGKQRIAPRRTSGPDSFMTAKSSGPWKRHFEPTRDDAAEAGSALADETGGQGKRGGGTTGRLIASSKTIRDKGDFRSFTDPDEIAEAERLAYRLGMAIRYRRSRRLKKARRGRAVDLRRTVRRNLGHGGELLDLSFRRTPDRPVKLILLLDVSGSMKLYSRFLLQFVKGLVCTTVAAEAFVFHTRLVRVTDAMREKNSIRAMTRLALMAEGFGGGTRLGASLKTFNDAYAKRLGSSRSVAVILSDGYETGTPGELSRELARLKKRVPRLIWLNPLLGWRDYEPVTAAMASALPHTDHFAAANSLESFAALEPALRRL